jgi:hypothetical protein
LDKSEIKEFDDMFDIPRLYVSACSSNSVQYVMLHPIHFYSAYRYEQTTK